MNGAKALCAGILMAAVTAPAAGQQADRSFCADRPGIGTPPCTLSPGTAQAEVGIGDWAWDKSRDGRTDTISLGEMLLRLGIADHLEAQMGWTAYGHVRERESGSVANREGVGDVTLALRRNLQNPDGSGISIAVMPYVTLPTGGQAIGAGDWAAGILIPSSFDLGNDLSFEATGEVDAAVDKDRTGRHLAWGETAGLQLAISEGVSASLEASALRDEDPAGHDTRLLTGVSMAWQASKIAQLDAGVNLGLNRDSPDAEIYIGYSRRL
ncbi:transporter [Sphingobium mellinum]|uniref:transporter n=1 Tax=Sphingobium mellinum TaxID=1387166 RepID=UPI0030EF98CF